MVMRAFKSFFALAVIVLFAAALALADRGKSVDIYTDAVLPNGQELKAGKYTVVLDESATKVVFKQGKKVVAEEKCKVVNQDKKNPTNQARFSETPDKKQKLDEIRLGGDTRTVIFEGM
jgi:hypothetical protein